MAETENPKQKAELCHILEQGSITPLFQPIIDLERRCIFGYEALSRAPLDSPLHMPHDLFQAARQHNMLFDLDRLCRKQAIARFQQLGLQQRLFLNIDPVALLDPDYKKGSTAEMLSFYRLACDRVVIELTEDSRVHSMEALKQAVAHYRSMGFLIALDDVGTGYSSLQLMVELKPEFIKLDKYFIQKLSTDPVANEFARAICNLAEKISCAVIAEGVETVSELNEVFAIRAGFAQGYFFSRPTAMPVGRLPQEFVDESMADAGTAVQQRVDITVTCREICRYLRPCEPVARGEDILKRFRGSEELLAIPVVRDGTPLGLCERHRLHGHFSSRYGHALYASKQVSALMNREPLCAELDTPLEDLSKLAMQRPALRLYDPVIMLDQGRYAGMVYINDLLEKITSISICRAMECNPLTQLPGNHAIESEVLKRLTAQKAFVLCYFDLDHFKSFNDYYGFDRGDTMIRLIADLLREEAAAADFVGHIGGDDFVLIVQQRHTWQCEVEATMERFVTLAHQLYDQEDTIKQYIEIENREGSLQTFPLISLSVGAVPCPPGRYTSCLEIAEVATELKHRSKLQSGNCLIVDQRRYKTPEQSELTPRFGGAGEVSSSAIAKPVPLQDSPYPNPVIGYSC